LYAESAVLTVFQHSDKWLSTQMAKILVWWLNYVQKLCCGHLAYVHIVGASDRFCDKSCWCFWQLHLVEIFLGAMAMTIQAEPIQSGVVRFLVLGSLWVSHSNCQIISRIGSQTLKGHSIWARFIWLVSLLGNRRFTPRGFK